MTRVSFSRLRNEPLKGAAFRNVVQLFFQAAYALIFRIRLRTSLLTGDGIGRPCYTSFLRCPLT